MKIGRLNINASRWPWQQMSATPEGKRINFGFRPHKSGVRGAILNPTSARFGGGWNYKLGIDIANRSILLHLLFGSVSFHVEAKKTAIDRIVDHISDPKDKADVLSLWERAWAAINFGIKPRVPEGPGAFEDKPMSELVEKVMTQEQFDALANVQPTAEHERRAEELMKPSTLHSRHEERAQAQAEAENQRSRSYEVGKQLYRHAVDYDDLGAYASSTHDVEDLRTGWMAEKNRQGTVGWKVPLAAPAPQYKVKE